METKTKEATFEAPCGHTLTATEVKSLYGKYTNSLSSGRRLRPSEQCQCREMARLRKMQRNHKCPKCQACKRYLRYRPQDKNYECINEACGRLGVVVPRDVVVGVGDAMAAVRKKKRSRTS